MPNAIHNADAIIYLPTSTSEGMNCPAVLEGDFGELGRRCPVRPGGLKEPEDPIFLVTRSHSSAALAFAVLELQVRLKCWATHARSLTSRIERRLRRKLRNPP